MYLIEWILGRMEKKKEKKQEGKTFWRMFSWEGERKKKGWGGQVFSSCAHEKVLSKIERKLLGKFDLLI